MALGLMLTAGVPALACPNCKEAIASAGDDDDPLREARAFNLSIYFMLAVPYTMLGVGGFIGYRMYRSAQRAAPATGQS
jgi:hypothetical protein